MEEAKYKQQELNFKEKSIVKDHILKKYSTISFLLLIKLEQSTYYDKVNINNSKLREFNFDLDEILKAHKKIEDTKLKLLLGNYNGNDNLNSDLLSIFF